MKFFTDKKKQVQKSQQSVTVQTESMQQKILQAEQFMNRAEGQLYESGLKDEKTAVPAAKVDFGVPQQQITTDKNIAAFSKEQQHGSFSEVRKNAFQENLINNIKWDRMEVGEKCSEEFKTVIGELAVYLGLEKEQTEEQKESKKENILKKEKELAGIRKKFKLQKMYHEAELVLRSKEKKEEKERLINELLNEATKEGIIENEKIESEKLKISERLKKRKKLKTSVIEKEKEIFARYCLYFDTFCDGQLKEKPADVEVIDGTQKNMTATNNTKDYYNKKDMRDVPLFSQEPSINDIHQFMLGDCYFEAAMGSVIANHPEKIKEMMKDNGDGTVTVCLYKKNKEKEDSTASKDSMKAYYVKVTKEIPVYQEKGLYTDSPLWMHMYQKAIVASGFLGLEKVEESENRKKPYEEGKNAAENEVNVWDEYVKKVEESLQTFENIKTQAETCKKEAEQAAKNYWDYKKEAEQAAKKYWDYKKEAEQAAKNYWDYKKEAEQAGANNEEYLKYENEAKQANLQYIEYKKQEEQANLQYIEYKKQEEQANLQYIEYKKQEEQANSQYESYKEQEIRKQYLEGVKQLNLRKDILKKWVNAINAIDIDIKNYQTMQKENSYGILEGGHMDNAFAMITGIKTERMTKEPVTYESIGDEIAELKKDSNVQSKVLEGFSDVDFDEFCDGLKKTLERHYKTIGMLKYTDTAITIEDVKKAVWNAEKWEKNDFYQKVYKKMEELNPEEKEVKTVTKESETQKQEVKEEAKQSETQKQEIRKRELKEKTAQQLQKIADNLEQYYEQLDKRIGLQHKKFTVGKSTDGSETGKYTQAALNMYNNIEKALLQEKLIGIGTKKFLSDAVITSLKMNRGSSRGEAIGGGLAQSHAYSIIGCMEKEGHKYIALRNPWGKVERVYGRTIKTKEGKKTESTYQEAESHTQQGQFYLELNDLMNSVNLFYGLNLL